MEATLEDSASGDYDLTQHLPIPADILEFAKEQKMRIVHVNAQREMGPPDEAKHLKLERGSEVYVGNIPRRFYEPDLLPFLEQVGPVYKLRLMMDFSGTNKGYCFVQYFHPSQADLAVATLHKKCIQNGYPAIICTKSVDNRKLVLGGVPTYKLEEEILAEMKDVSCGVLSVLVTWSQNDRPLRGLVFVTYESHRAAALARKNMLARSTMLWGYPVSVDWAEPERELCGPVYHKKPQVLRVTNLTPRIKNSTIVDIFNRESCNGVTKLCKRYNDAYIFFSSRSQAETAKVAINGTIIDGNKIVVEWMNPNYIPKKRRRNARRVKFSKTVSVAMISSSCTSTQTVTASFEQLLDDDVSAEPNNTDDESSGGTNAAVVDEDVSPLPESLHQDQSHSQPDKKPSHCEKQNKKQRRKRISQVQRTIPGADFTAQVNPQGLWDMNAMMNCAPVGFETLMQPSLLYSTSDMNFPTVAPFNEITGVSKIAESISGTTDSAPASVYYFYPVSYQQPSSTQVMLYTPYFHDPLSSESHVPMFSQFLLPYFIPEDHPQAHYADAMHVQQSEEQTANVMAMGQ